MMSVTAKVNNFFGRKHTEVTKLQNRLWHLGRHHIIETKRKMSDSRKGKKLSEVHKQKLSLALRGKPKPWLVGKPRSKEIMMKVSLSQKGTKHNISEQCRRNIGNATRERNLHLVFPTKDTKPERLLQLALSMKEISYEKHKSIFGRPDIFIEPNLCIFVDGKYWHTLPKSIQRDTIVNEKLEKDGYKILRFSDQEIYNSINNVVEQIEKII